MSHTEQDLINDVLLTLRGTGPDAYHCDDHPDVWHARCPACGTDDHRLRITLRHGQLELWCALGCTRASLFAALDLAERRYVRGDPQGWDWHPLDTPRPDRVARIADKQHAELEHARQVAGQIAGLS